MTARKDTQRTEEDTGMEMVMVMASTREHDDRNPGGRGYGSSHDEPDYRPYQEQPRHQPDYAPHFDSGGYDRSLIRFPSPPSTSSAGGYAGQDYREYADQAPAARPDRPRRRPNTAPNNSVILIGLPQMATEDDVRSFIDEFKAHPDDPSAVENATIVIDKQTGQSKRFGFVRFISLEHARAFVEANFDHVLWKSRGSHDITEDGTKIRIDYASSDKRPSDSDVRNRAGRELQREAEVESRPMQLNDGSGDMGSSANKILLVRGLDPLTQAVDITRRLGNMDEATIDRVKNAKGSRRVVLIKDKITNASWCFAFVVYPDEECAKAALRTIIDPVAFPTGFTIADKLVAVTFARVGCFSKAYAKTTWSFSEEEADGKRQEYQYWDDNAYGAVFDDPAYRSALETKQLDDTKAADVDAFLSSLEKDHPAEVVKAPPAISLNLFGSVPQGLIPKEKKKGGTELIISKKTNLGDEAKVRTTLEAVAALPAGSQVDTTSSQYRDRALERRLAYNQPEHVPLQKKHKKNSEPAPKPVVSAPEKHIEESNIGSKLLANMGWSAGKGLGSESAGRVAPIQAKAFSAGAGIGASKGVDASEQAGAGSWGTSELGRMKAKQRMQQGPPS
ncbi:hypothetical protein EMMF5_003325 [Cystobasidiomycetes sp. EMM_F5]